MKRARKFCRRLSSEKMFFGRQENLFFVIKIKQQRKIIKNNLKRCLEEKINKAEVNECC